MQTQVGQPGLQVLKDLEQLTTDMTQREIVQHGVDIAQRATDSRIAYLHFLNEDQNTVELGVWSRDTLAGCKAVYARHYPVDSAGIWADSFRTRRACVHNDYAAQSEKRGLPSGHCRLERHLGLPVIDRGMVRMLIGVGNKSYDYDSDDVDLLDAVARRIWSVVRQRRVLEHLLDIDQRFRHVQELASVCALEYDVDENRLTVDATFASLFRIGKESAVPTTLDGFLSFVALSDHPQVRGALAGSSSAPQPLRISCLRPGREHFPAELKAEYRPRELGHGVICFGILQDISDQVAAEELRQRADHDPLTGLPNRHRLNAWFRQRLGRRGADDRLAVHFIDLDQFKPVNDTWGHQIGDEVLRVIAQRLLHVVRKEDLVVRMGGDEFIVVQTGVDDPAAVHVLAEKILTVLASPIPALGRPVHVGASIGIALGASEHALMWDLVAAADRALYQAKAAGGQRYVIAAGCDG